VLEETIVEGHLGLIGRLRNRLKGHDAGWPAARCRQIPAAGPNGLGFLSRGEAEQTGLFVGASYPTGH
jgi:hypothetical protein